MNLTDLLAALSNLDDAPHVEFDPAQVVGDVREKVDAIHKVLGRLAAERDRLREDADELAKASSQVERSRQRLFEYLQFSMLAQGFEKLPGNTWRVQFQKSTPALELEREANVDDFIATAALVRRTVTYAWNKDKVKELIAAGESFPHGRIVQGQHLRFYPNKGADK